jgi:hypothetical protein
MWRVVCAALCAAAIHAAPARAAESANGKLAATLFDRLVTLNPDGTNQRTVWKVPGEGDSIANPVWSPDGNRIAFNYWDPVHDTRIAVYDLRTGAVRVVTDHPGPDADGNHTEDFDPGWTPDGRVAFRRAVYDSESQHHALMTVGADGTGLQPLPVDDQDGFSVSWSPLGWVLYADFDDNLHIASLDGADDEILPFTDVPHPAAFSPDGEWLLFADHGLGAISLDGDEADFTSPEAPADDFQPAWSPDGHAIVYRHTQLEKGRLVEQLEIHDIAANTDSKVIPGSYGSPTWQPCVAGVTVSCRSQPIACRQPSDPPGWDPQPLCLPPQPQPQPVPRPSIQIPPLHVDHVTTRLHRRAGYVALRARCSLPCTVTAHLRVRLHKSKRLLTGRQSTRSGRTLALKLKLPHIPRHRRIASVRVTGTATALLQTRRIAATVRP